MKNYLLSPGTIDCNFKGMIVFDAKNVNNNNSHHIKCYNKTKPEDKYDTSLDGDKKIIKFFGNYVIEVKTDKSQDKIQIYDFDNKLSLFNATYPEIF